MIEFLVRPINDDWFDFSPGSDPYRPTTIAFQKSDQEEMQIEIEGSKISFSYEDPGIQISFEGQISQERATQIAEEIRQKIHEVSGQPARLVQISCDTPTAF